ncbi:MAG TPA: ABC transporter permease [Candidatus Anoxymicrobiaceae bacterium]
MTDVNATAFTPDVFRHRIPFVGAFRDTMAITRRNLISLKRTPRFFVFTMVQPVIFVILFRYVFGGAISITLTGVPYVDYLMPGIFVQTVTFGAITTGISMATDVQSGVLERFRSLPMARSGVLTGRTTADLLRNILVIVLIAGVGFAVGFRFHTSWALFFCALALVVFWAYALSWVFALVGLVLKDPETAQAASFPIIAPLVFASSAFVPVSTMPSWLQGWAKYQPVSVTVSAARALCMGGPTASWLIQSLIWCAGIILVCAPLAVRYYRRSA